MSQILVNHTDTVVSILIAEPFQTWEDWRAVEEARLHLTVDPMAMVDSLEEVRRLFDESILSRMSQIGIGLLRDMVEGDLSATRGFDLCLQWWDCLPYYSRTFRGPVDINQVLDVFYRFPWFFYLLFTDPAL